MKPKTTVYIISHNYGRYLTAAIESVIRQTSRNWELLLIDNGSTDDTFAIMSLYQSDERIRIFKIDEVNLPSACNFALKKANGEYIVRLDGDDVFDENALLVMEHSLDQQSDAALVFPDYYLMDELGEIFGQERRKKIAEDYHLFDVPPNGACTLIRKDVLLQVGGYREDLGAQDGFDLWSKISAKHKCININLPLFYYRKHGENLTNNQPHILYAKQQIKIDAISPMLDEFRPLIAVIPCRKNFDFCPDVWKEKINDKSLLEKSLETCLRSPLLDYVIVSSDNPEVREMIQKYNDKRIHFDERPREETIRSQKLVYTLQRIAAKFDPHHKGIMVISYLQSPFVKTATLEEAISTLMMNRADSSMGVTEIRHALYKKTPYGLQAVNPSAGVTTDFDLVYKETNTALATKTSNFASGSLSGPRVVNFVVLEEESYFINSHKSLEIARKMEQLK